MNADMKRRRLLRNLAKQGGTQLLVDLQPRGAEYFYLAKENRSRATGRFPPSHLPFRRPNTALVSYHGSRIIGHIYGLNDNMEIVINRSRHTTASTSIGVSCSLEQKRSSMLRDCEETKDSSTSSVSAFVNSTELAGYSERDNSNTSRQTSSSSSTSVALERKSYSKNPQHPINRSTRQKTNGVTQSHDRHERHTSSDTLPIVCTDESANTSLHALPPNARQGRAHHLPMQSTTNTQKAHSTLMSPTSRTQRINSLSISGIKQENGAINVRADDTTTEEEDCRPTQLVINDRLASKPSPPSLQLYPNTTQPSGATSHSYGPSSRRNPTKTHSSGRKLHSKQKSDPEPKYADPISGSTTSFQSRLAELASLEADTVRWERMRKLKKKSRDD